jgi:hypothetical protein
MPLKSHTKERILHFLNEAKGITDITAPEVLQDHQGNGYTIGETVAQRILAQRDHLPGKQFVNFEDLDAVPGLGNDKLVDLAHSIARPAAQYFRSEMFRTVIGENWELTPHTFAMDDRAAFFDLVQTPSRFAEWVGERVEEVSLEKSNNPAAARLANLLLQRCYLDRYEDSHLGSFAFAFWLYRFDADNWFLFEKVRVVMEHYLSYYAKNQHRLEFRIFRGFENNGVLAQPITRPDLPVVVNYGEQEVTLWAAQLSD